jgi:membrane protease YdiL (CAAX protease family)
MNSTYWTRLLIMVFVALPLTIVFAIVSSSLDPVETATLRQQVGFWAGLILLYGLVPAAVLSLVHTTIALRQQRNRTASITFQLALSIGLGLVVGIMLSLLLDSLRAQAVVWGVLLGGAYGIVVARRSSR